MAFQKQYQYRTGEEIDIIDITEDVSQAVMESGVETGSVTVFTPGSTAAITTIEYESGVLEDLRRTIAEIVPRDREYRHDARWGDGNGHSHVRAALLGPSQSVPVLDGRPTLGTWQQLVVLDFDNRPRTRKVVIVVQ